MQRGDNINGAWKMQSLSLSHPPFGCSQLTQMDGSSLQGFSFSSQVLFDKSDIKTPPRNTHHHFRAPDLNCAQDVSRACQGTLTHAPAKLGGSNCFLDGITDAPGGFVGAISRPDPKATFRINRELIRMG